MELKAVTVVLVEMKETRCAERDLFHCLKIPRCT